MTEIGWRVYPILFGLIMAGVAMWTFCIMYLQSRWRAHPVGVHLMVFTALSATIITLSLSRYAGLVPREVYFSVIALLYPAFAAVSWQRVYLLRKEQAASRRKIAELERRRRDGESHNSGRHDVTEI